MFVSVWFGQTVGIGVAVCMPVWTEARPIKIDLFWECVCARVVLFVCVCSVCTHKICTTVDMQEKSVSQFFGVANSQQLRELDMFQSARKTRYHAQVHTYAQYNTPHAYTYFFLVDCTIWEIMSTKMRISIALYLVCLLTHTHSFVHTDTPSCTLTLRQFL